jgi:hypothetical protein
MPHLFVLLTEKLQKTYFTEHIFINRWHGINLDIFWLKSRQGFNVGSKLDRSSGFRPVRDGIFHDKLTCYPYDVPIGTF